MDKISSNKDSRILRVNRWLHAMPVWQNALVATAVWFWVLTLCGDITRIIWPSLLPFYRIIDGPLILQFAIGCLLTSFYIGGFFIGPVCFVGWGIHHIYTYFKYHRKRFSIFIQITEYIGWVFILFIMVLIPLGIFMITEQLEAV